MRHRVLNTTGILVAALVCLVAVSRMGLCDDNVETKSSVRTEIFSGEARLLIVHGYSTSAHWWAFLQRKIDRYMGGPERRTVEVQLCNKGGTPIAKWMDVTSGERSRSWKQMFTPMIQAEKDNRPVVILAQQSLQWVYGERSGGIRDENDHDRIKKGADAIRQYAGLILGDGANDVIIATHIYKQGMEPQIGNERMALAELMTRNPARVHAGPDVWSPTKAQYPLAFDRDKRHPNFVGAEIMAHYWFVSLLKHDGLEVPQWSYEEMEAAVAKRPLGLTRDRDAFRRLLTKWKISDRRASSPPGGRRLSDRIMERYDKDGDGQLNEKERAAFDRARAARSNRSN